MAGRSMKVRQVFAELRRALGAEIPAGELLGLAAALVDAAAPVECPDEHRAVPDRPASDQRTTRPCLLRWRMARHAS